jgi:hypothetical protein
MLRPHCRQERPDSHYVHDAGEVVGQHVQRHLCGDLWQRLHQEVGGAHPGLDGAEGMLDRFAPLPHLLWVLIEPALHGFENVLMLPSGDPTLLAGSATLLDDTALASIGPVAAQDQSVFLGRVASSAIPHRSDRCVGPARTEAAAIPATVDKMRRAEIIPAGAIPVARRKVWYAVDRPLRSINWNAVVGRLMITGQKAIAMPVVDDGGLSVHRRGECNGGQR